MVGCNREQEIGSKLNYGFSLHTANRWKTRKKILQ